MSCLTIGQECRQLLDISLGEKTQRPSINHAQSQVNIVLSSSYLLSSWVCALCR